MRKVSVVGNTDPETNIELVSDHVDAAAAQDIVPEEVNP